MRIIEIKRAIHHLPAASASRPQAAASGAATAGWRRRTISKPKADHGTCAATATASDATRPTERARCAAAASSSSASSRSGQRQERERVDEEDHVEEHAEAEPAQWDRPRDATVSGDLTARRTAAKMRKRASQARACGGLEAHFASFVSCRRRGERRQPSRDRNELHARTPLCGAARHPHRRRRNCAAAAMVVEARVESTITKHAWNADRSLLAVVPNSNVVNIYKAPKARR